MSDLGGQFSYRTWYLYSIFSQIAYWLQGKNNNSTELFSQKKSWHKWSKLTSPEKGSWNYDPAHVIPCEGHNTTSLMSNSYCRFLRNLIMRKYQKKKKNPNEKHSSYFYGGGAVVYENVNIIKDKKSGRTVSD